MSTPGDRLMQQHDLIRANFDLQRAQNNARVAQAAAAAQGQQYTPATNQFEISNAQSIVQYVAEALSKIK